MRFQQIAVVGVAMALTSAQTIARSDDDVEAIARTDDNVDCNMFNLEPVCNKDGEIFGNECLLKTAHNADNVNDEIVDCTTDQLTQFFGIDEGDITKSDEEQGEASVKHLKAEREIIKGSRESDDVDHELSNSGEECKKRRLRRRVIVGGWFGRDGSWIWHNNVEGEVSLVTHASARRRRSLLHSRRPSARSTSKCTDECYKIFLPVCADNGEVYANECLFNFAKCKNATLQAIDCS